MCDWLAPRDRWLSARVRALSLVGRACAGVGVGVWCSLVKMLCKSAGASSKRKPGIRGNFALAVVAQQVAGGRVGINASMQMQTALKCSYYRRVRNADEGGGRAEAEGGRATQTTRERLDERRAFF